MNYVSLIYILNVIYIIYIYIYYDALCDMLHMKHECHDMKHVIDRLINEWTSHDIDMCLNHKIMRNILYYMSLCENIIMCKNYDGQKNNDFTKQIDEFK